MSASETDRRFEGRHLLITGASSGIGLATAVRASRSGARVTLIARGQSELETALLQLDGEGHSYYVCDVADHSRVASLLPEVAATHGPIHCVVHAAGIHALSPVRATSPNQVAEMFEVNVTSALMIAKAFRKRDVRADDANVVLLSSAIGVVGSSGVSAYAASKAAVSSLAQSLGLEFAREGIRVNAVAAGIVATPLTRRLRGVVGEAGWDRIVEAHPLGIGAPDDVAAAALFLASSDARWITGTTLRVDGGYTAQ